MSKLSVVLMAALACAPGAQPSGPATAADKGLAVHLKLAGDCRDSSPGAVRVTNHGARLEAGGAAFDGLDDWIELPPDSFRPGKGDFTVATWVHTEAELDDVLGDILSRYDPDARTGFSLGMMDYAGGTSSQANWRNLSFGIDADRIDPAWTDCGRPGNSVFVMALAVYDGALYAGTYEAGADETGHVYRYDGGARWTDCGAAPDRANSIGSLAVYNGKLYAGSMRWDAARGSGLPKSANVSPGGKVFRYEGGAQWTDCGRLGEEASEVFSMAAFRGRLYACPAYIQGRGLYRYEGGTRWTLAACPPGGHRVNPLVAYNGHFYGGGFSGAQFFRYDGEHTLTDLGRVPDSTQVYAFAVYQGRLYTGTWPKGAVYLFDGKQGWSFAGRLGPELEVNAMSVYNGKLYAGTIPLAQVYRFDGGTKWTFTGQLDRTPGKMLRRAFSMAVFQGKLFCGTVPSGRVLSLEAGRCATCDRELAPGWRHVAAVKAGGLLKLYVDGRPAGNSSAFDPAQYEVSNRQPLAIGFGPNDYFRGRLRDLRIYRRALAQDEIQSLAKQ
jgi:hypothetical protein